MNRIDGNYQEFLQVVQSSKLREAEKTALSQFLNRFPEATFYRFANIETGKYPEWLKTYRETLDGFFFGQLRWLLFSEHARVYPNTTLFTEEPYWYSCKFSPKVSSEHEDVFLDGQPLMIVAYYPQTGDSYLAVKAGVDSTDQTVYDFGVSSLEKNKNGQWDVTPGAASAAFGSLAEMYSQVIAIKGDTLLLREKA